MATDDVRADDTGFDDPERFETDTTGMTSMGDDARQGGSSQSDDDMMDTDTESDLV